MNCTYAGNGTIVNIRTWVHEKATTAGSSSSDKKVTLKNESELVSPQYNPNFHLQWFAGSTPVVATHGVRNGGAF